MAQVTVTYNAWDHDQGKIPESLRPQVGFRPLATSLVSGMMTNREVWGTLDYATGAGSVKLESAPGLLYVPFMRWLTDPSQANEQVENRSYGYCEWKPFFPGNGGPIDQLPDVVPAFSAFYYGFGDPPQFLRVRDDVVYIDITGGGSGWWTPWVPEGTAVP